MLLAAVLALGGCSYIFSEKRTVYQFDPSYGVESPEFVRSLDGLGTEMVPGNAARLLQNGEGIFPAMLAAVAGAKESINLEIYIFDHGQIATGFAEALAERARAGVEVRLLVDAWGSNLGPLAPMLEAAGARVRIYKPLKLYSIDRVGNRTHRRILTVDGRIGFCGGVGIDDRWKGDARDPSQWRDTMIEIEGPVVTQLQHVFAQDWVHTTGEVLNGNRQFPPIAPAGPMLAQAIAAARADSISMSKLVLYMAIQAARRSIWIENAYFVPDRQIREGLAAAARRGVDVKVIVPGSHTDSPNVRYAAHYHFGVLLEAGVGIYEYRPTMMHNKVMVVDGIWSTIGSINFVNRSMTKNAEVNIAVYDRAFAAEVGRMMLADLGRCDVLTEAAWKKRGLFERMGELFFFLFAENY
ncbi:MAG TPA: phospholipase D-like domain-containing protein [Thermoanaerobaculia bacterium]|nr:phospholipase D-like domain-containing protein [Thermoanaerobaculia bacterium]